MIGRAFVCLRVRACAFEYVCLFVYAFVAWRNACVCVCVCVFACVCARCVFVCFRVCVNLCMCNYLVVCM